MAVNELKVDDAAGNEPDDDVVDCFRDDSNSRFMS